MTFTAGARLGPYEIIGAGGMGEVCRGRSATLNRETNACETRSFDVTRDGSRTLAIRIPPANRSRRIEVITNWTSELPRLAPRGTK